MLLGFPRSSVVKNLPAMQETQFQSLGGDDPLEKEMATHPSILAWEIPWTEGAWQDIIDGIAKSWTDLKQQPVEEAHVKLNLKANWIFLAFCSPACSNWY